MDGRARRLRVCTSVAKTLQSVATRRLSHPSGRPWILGRWIDGAVCTSEAGPATVAVVGNHDATPDKLAAEATRMRRLSDVDRLMGSMTGMYHLVASVNGRVRVQGNVTGAGAPVVAYTAESRDPLAEDEAWPVRTVAGLGDAVEHHLIPAHEIPLMYHDVGRIADPLDEPCAAAIDGSVGW